MPREANKAVFQAVMDALANRRAEVRGAHPGLAAMKPDLAALFVLQPGSPLEIREVIADGEWVAARLVRRMAQEAVWGDEPPIPPRVNREGIVTCRFANGLIVELHSQSSIDRPTPAGPRVRIDA